MIESINFCLTNRCGASCVYCPSDKGLASTSKVMNFQTAKTIIDKAKKVEGVKRIVFGENGDLFLNNDWHKILSYARLQLRNKQIIIFTNFQNLDVEASTIIIKEGLTNKIICNIDSINPKTYSKTKHLSFERVWQNLNDFLSLRQQSSSQIVLLMNVLHPTKYFSVMNNVFGVVPTDRVFSSADDEERTIRTLTGLLRQNDEISSANPCFWAERCLPKQYFENAQLKSFSYCPQLSRIKTEAFISPDGIWYACCLDSKQELVLGDLTQQSFQEVFEGEIRQKLLEHLEQKKFEKIGGPCNTVLCCHSYEVIQKGD